MATSNVVHAAFPKPLSEDATRSYTLPADYYIDPDVFELEKERIFFRTWQYVGPASEVAKAGDYMTTTVVDQGVFVIRGRDGVLRAFYNVCQHRAHELLQGKGNVKAVITCPYHAWAYAPDGSLRAARNCEMVAGFDKQDFGLRPVRVEEFCNLVFVNLDDDAVPLAEQASHLEASIRAFVPNYDELVFTGTSTFGDDVMQAGWKVVVDNYVECYHCGPAHPAFADMIDMACYEHTIEGISAFQLGPETKPENSAYNFQADDPIQRAAFWYLWPTTTINIVPGSVSVNITHIVPRSPTTTSFVNDRLTVAGEPEDEARNAYLFDLLGREDQLLCESVQRGLQSRAYDQGRFIADEAMGGEAEHVVHFFHHMVRQALEEPSSDGA
ncbi:MAG: aromatic ring-hydroxylating dioxygenase subunit alpha [Pseudomonadota bacterium]